LVSGSAKASRCATAVHRGVAYADDENFLADRVDVSEVDRAKPLDADVNFFARARIPTAGNVQLFTFGAPLPTKIAS
jgi:hypothetical protein